MVGRMGGSGISKYAPGDDGRTPFGRIRREVRAVPLVCFGEIVSYLPLQMAMDNKGQRVKKQGVWLGTIGRIESGQETDVEVETNKVPDDDDEADDVGDNLRGGLDSLQISRKQ